MLIDIEQGVRICARIPKTWPEGLDAFGQVIYFWSKNARWPQVHELKQVFATVDHYAAAMVLRGLVKHCVLRLDEKTGEVRIVGHEHLRAEPPPLLPSDPVLPIRLVHTEEAGHAA